MVGASDAVRGAPASASFAVAVLRLRGLRSRPKLNGLHVTLKSWDAGRWRVAAQGASTLIAVRPECLGLHQEDGVAPARHAVRIQNVNGREELNGQSGTRTVFHADRWRWQVSLPDGEDILLRSDRLSTVEGAPVVDPVYVGSWKGAEDSRALFAATDFRPKELIFQEKPAVELPRDAKRSRLDLYTELGLRTEALSSLKPDVRKDYLELAAQSDFRAAIGPKGTLTERDCYATSVIASNELRMGLAHSGYAVPSSEWEDVARSLRIWQCNSFATKTGSAVFLVLSRANHSCDPNVYRADLPDGSCALIALRPIVAGEELCVSYLCEKNLAESTDSRQWRLQPWGFSCECDRCRANEDPQRAFCCSKSAACSGQHIVKDGSLSVCSQCGDVPSLEVCRALLAKETVLVNLYRTFERDPARIPEPVVTLPEVLAKSKRIFTNNHWVTQGFLDMNQDLRTQLGDIDLALEHIEARLRAWEVYMSRPCIQIGFLHETRADLLLRLGRRLEAAEGYLTALGMLGALVLPDDRWLAEPEEELRQCLAG